MASPFVAKVLRLSLEEKILNIGSLVALVCVFFPWIGGEWLGGKNVTYSGLGFFTSFIGLSILLLHLYLLLITLIPLTGGPTIVTKQSRNGIRLFVTLLASVLTVAAWSVLTKFTFEFRLQINFGLYGTLMGSLVSCLYAFLLFQDKKKGEVHDFFHQEKGGSTPTVEPPSPGPEDHRF